MEYHKKMCPKYIQLTFPLIGYVSGGLMKIAIRDVYTYYVIYYIYIYIHMKYNIHTDLCIFALTTLGHLPS